MFYVEAKVGLRYSKRRDSTNFKISEAVAERRVCKLEDNRGGGGREQGCIITSGQTI